MTKLQAAKSKALKLWGQMCVADGLPADSKFVVFSASNPIKPKYDAAFRNYMRLRCRATEAQLNALDARR